MGFRLVLEAEDDIEVVGEAGDGAQGVALTTALRPDVVLMDVRMPGMNGIEATERIIASSAWARVLILTTFDLAGGELGEPRVGSRFAGGGIARSGQPTGEHLEHPPGHPR
ncbi:MAG TPA: response regulator transcription factor [Nakamurella sp.]|nr:response regulator transcription factor [Nakamurella sp.]